MTLQNNNRPVFYIDAPPYTDFSSGVKCLYMLCDLLNNNGYEAYMTEVNSNGNLWAPQSSSSLLELHRSSGRLQIAIYPEIEMGNPLRVPNVARFFLNQPNFFNINWFGMFYENEYLIHYSEDFIIPWVQSDYFRILTIDRNIYKMPESASEERSGFLVYAHRVNPPLEQLPDWCKPYTVISMRNPVAPVELAELYKRSRGLIMYERSAAYAEALLCGCPIILVPGAALPEFPKVLNEFSNLGVAWGLDLDQYEHAAKTAALFSKAYTSSELLDQQKFQVTIHKIIDHFKQKHLESSFNPSIEMELAKNEYKNGLFKNAILRYDKIIGQSKANIEAYYRMSLALVKINMLDAARTVLLKGENKLSAMPEHNSLNGVRTLYYNLLTRISLTVKDDEQAEKFKELFLKYNTITAKIEPDLRL